MKKAKVTNTENIQRKIRPALTPDARENQLISLAVEPAKNNLWNVLPLGVLGGSHKFKKIY